MLSGWQTVIQGYQEEELRMLHRLGQTKFRNGLLQHKKK